MADVTQLIEQDHREVEGLFEQFKNGGSESVAAKICEELEVHAAAEEKVFYPVVKSDVPGGDDMASEGNEEHGEARQLIGRIKQTSDEAHLADLVTDLEEAVSHHVQEEESEMLPKTRDALDAARLDELGASFESEKANLQS